LIEWRNNQRMLDHKLDQNRKHRPHYSKQVPRRTLRSMEKPKDVPDKGTTFLTEVIKKSPFLKENMPTLDPKYDSKMNLRRLGKGAQTPNISTVRFKERMTPSGNKSINNFFKKERLISNCRKKICRETIKDMKSQRKALIRKLVSKYSPVLTELNKSFK